MPHVIKVVVTSIPHTLLVYSHFQRLGVLKSTRLLLKFDRQRKEEVGGCIVKVEIL